MLHSSMKANSMSTLDYFKCDVVENIVMVHNFSHERRGDFDLVDDVNNNLFMKYGEKVLVVSDDCNAISVLSCAVDHLAAFQKNKQNEAYSEPVGECSESKVHNESLGCQKISVETIDPLAVLAAAVEYLSSSTNNHSSCNR